MIRALLAVAVLAGAQTLPQDRLRTGMAEVGIRAWEVDPRANSISFWGVSASRFLTDNASAGLMLARAEGEGPFSGAVLAEGVLRHYPLALERWTPWFELRAGAVIPPEGSSPSRRTGATHLGLGVGLRWRPLPRLCADLQLLGVERWGYSDPSEGTGGSVEWALQGSPLRAGGWRIVPAPSVQFIF